MALTPSEVEQKTFSTALRGYDLDEVDDFLDEVVSSLRDLNDQLAAAKAEPATTAPPLVPAAEPVDESAIGRALVAAQTAADSLVADAQSEADRLVAEAKVEAESWSVERDAKKAEADAEMLELTEKVSGIRTQLALLATAVADRLDEMDQAIGGFSSEDVTGDLETAGDDAPADSDQSESDNGDDTDADADSSDHSAVAWDAVGDEDSDAATDDVESGDDNANSDSESDDDEDAESDNSDDDDLV